MSDLPKVLTVREVVKESPTVTTIRFNEVIGGLYGQFVMVWAPGVDEVPMAVSYADGITVQKVGDATTYLSNVQARDKLGIRGPFGRGFRLSGRVAVIGGGVGVAPLLRIGLEYPDVEFFEGARTCEELLFYAELKEFCPVHVSTDDGSIGYHGYIADLFAKQDLSKFDTICVCGPDLMMKSVLSVIEKNGALNKSQFSLHRYMKCGVGLCGSCCLDPEGFCVCKDGPVFSGEIVRNSDICQKHRDGSGRRV